MSIDWKKRTTKRVTDDEPTLPRISGDTVFLPPTELPSDYVEKTTTSTGAFEIRYNRQVLLEHGGVYLLDGDVVEVIGLQHSMAVGSSSTTVISAVRKN